MPFSRRSATTIATIPASSSTGDEAMSTQTYRDSETVDFVVVGSGAAGGVMARELAQAGLSVVRDGAGTAALAGGLRARRAEVLVPRRHHQRCGQESADVPQTIRQRRPSCRSSGRRSGTDARVGGRSLHYTANFWRFHEIDFIERSVLGAIAGTGFADWPITYAELEPYYTKVEWEIGVSGLAGASPFDPPRTQALSDAAAAGEVVRRAVRARRAQAGLASVSGADGDQLAAVPRPAGLRALRLLPRLRAARCGAKASTLTTVIPEAEATGRCEVRPDSYVVAHRDQQAADARPASPISIANGASSFRQARAVVVCANGAETPRLLLMSANAQFPHGLANSSGLVGKYLMFNYSGARARRVRARAERVQERAGHAHPARLLRLGSEARLLRRRRPRCAHRAAADDLGAFAPPPRARRGAAPTRRG